MTVIGIAIFLGAMTLTVFAARALSNSLDEFEFNIRDLSLQNRE